MDKSHRIGLLLGYSLQRQTAGGISDLLEKEESQRVESVSGLSSLGFLTLFPLHLNYKSLGLEGSLDSWTHLGQVTSHLVMPTCRILYTRQKKDTHYLLIKFTQVLD